MVYCLSTSNNQIEYDIRVSYLRHFHYLYSTFVLTDHNTASLPAIKTLQEAMFIFPCNVSGEGMTDN